MTTVRNTKQIVVSSTAAKLLVTRTSSRTALGVIPTTAVNVWVGSNENVSKTTGWLVNQTIPFIATETEFDPTEELWCISDSSTPTVAIYEDLEQ